MMRLLRGHIDLLALERFVAGDCRDRESRKIADHLDDCGRCRARLEWLRALPEQLESATRPPLPEDMENRILARRAAGDRVILPVDGLEPVSRRSQEGLRRLGAAAAAIATLGLVGGLLFLQTRELGALWSEVIFDPTDPGPGERVEVTYRPVPELADEEWLVLRGRVTGPVDYATAPSPPERLAVLRRTGGSYHGTFTLDEDAVYAQVVVQDSAGFVVDDRGGRLWHLHVHRAGIPLSEALWAHALLATDWEDAHRSLERATRLYPRNPRLRASKLSSELEILSQSARDSALKAHREMFQSLAHRLSEEDNLTAETLAGLVEYANELGDTSGAREWTTQLMERFPEHPETIWYRLSSPPADRDEESLRSYLAKLETLWLDAGPHPRIANAGFWTARQLGDPAETLRWAERKADHPGFAQVQPGEIALALAEVPGLRAVALQHIRQQVRDLDRPRDPNRPLDRTVSQHERERRRAMRPLLVRLGELLLEQGERDAALDTLRVAASIGWDPSLHRRVAELELATGDTLAAALSLARAAAPKFNRDPPGADEGLAIARGPELVPPDLWVRMRRGARDEMYQLVLSRSVAMEPRARPIYLFDSQGDRHTLRELSHRTVTLVAFWEPWSAPAVDDLPRLRRLIYLVRAMGAEAIVITEQPPGERLDAALGEHRGVLPVYHDLDRRASAAFRQYGAPEYFVLGFDGRIRFARTNLDDILSQVDALLNEPRLSAAVAP